MPADLNLYKAFVLHRRNYTDTSLIVDLFTQEKGRISVIAKGARRKKSILKAVLQPFGMIGASWFGKSELMTLRNAEALAAPTSLKGVGLYSGFYMNEILMRLLDKFDPHPHVFNCYVRALTNLKNHDVIEKSLRVFELELLQELGYGLALNQTNETNVKINESQRYYFSVDSGISSIDNTQRLSTEMLFRTFTGISLLKINDRDFSDIETLRDAKRLTRIAFKPLLGDKPLQSRELFR